MKKLIRFIPGVIALVLLLTILSGCSNSGTAESIEAATSSIEESVQQTLTASAGTAEPQANGDGVSTTVPSETAGIDCSLPLPTEKSWPVTLCEKFDDNSHGWIVESQDNPYANYDIAVEGGKYALTYTAKGFANFQRTALTWFDVAAAQNFALSVNTLMNSDFQSSSWGVAFRGDEDSFFLFSIYNNGDYIFEIYENDGWVPLITQRPFDGILPNAENKLTIVAEDGDFSFYINDELVNTFSGGLLQGSDILLVVSAKEGVSADYYFDDIVMQTGSSD